MFRNSSTLRLGPQWRSDSDYEWRLLSVRARHQQRRLAREIPAVDDILEWQGCYGFWNPDFPRP